MAERGAPLGNQNAAKARKWSNAIERALEHWPNRAPSLSVNRGMDDAAFAFVDKLMTEKDLGFFREMGDRIEGKSVQQMDVNQTVKRDVADYTDDELALVIAAREAK